MFHLVRVALILLVGLSIGCSLKEDLDETQATTKRMEATTRGMADTTTTMYSGARSAFGLTMAKEALDKLFETSDTQAMLDYAITFFGALPFQEWQGRGRDSQEVREELYNGAVKLFFSSIQRLVDDSYPVNPKIPSKNWLRLSALSVAMSYISDDQKVLARDYKFEARSVYDLIVEGLQRKNEFTNSDNAPEWITSILRSEDIALYMLQLRHNYFPLVIASRLSAIEDKTWGLPLNYLTQTTFWNWKVDLDRLNYAQVEQILEWLEKIDHTRVVLVNLGEKVQFNSSVIRLMRNLVWEGTESEQNAYFRSRMQEVLGAKPTIGGAKPERQRSSKPLA
jgi:hypothetical protein